MGIESYYICEYYNFTPLVLQISLYICIYLCVCVRVSCKTRQCSFFIISFRKTDLAEYAQFASVCVASPLRTYFVHLLLLYLKVAVKVEFICC